MDQESWIDASFTLPLMGVPINFKATIPANPVKPQAMLPVYRQLSQIFINIGVRAAEKDGRTISCNAGCSACCYQPIPLAEIEIYHVAALVEAMPEERRAILKKRFQEGVTRLTDNGWLQRFEQCKDEEEFVGIAFEYFSMRIPCPFLEEGNCSIYEQRPIICREYLVTSPASHCDQPNGNSIDRLPLPTSATHGTCRTGRSKNLTKKNFHLLMFALNWVAEYPEPFSEKTGEEWLKEFFSVAEPVNT